MVKIDVRIVVVVASAFQIGCLSEADKAARQEAWGRQFVEQHNEKQRREREERAAAAPKRPTTVVSEDPPPAPEDPLPPRDECIAAVERARAKLHQPEMQILDCRGEQTILGMNPGGVMFADCGSDRRWMQRCTKNRLDPAAEKHPATPYSILQCAYPGDDKMTPALAICAADIVKASTVQINAHTKNPNPFGP